MLGSKAPNTDPLFQPTLPYPQPVLTGPPFDSRQRHLRRPLLRSPQPTPPLIVQSEVQRPLGTDLAKPEVIATDGVGVHLRIEKLRGGGRQRTERSPGPLRAAEGKKLGANGKAKEPLGGQKSHSGLPKNEGLGLPQVPQTTLFDAPFVAGEGLPGGVVKQQPEYPLQAFVAEQGEGPIRGAVGGGDEGANVEGIAQLGHVDASLVGEHVVAGNLPNPILGKEVEAVGGGEKGFAIVGRIEVGGFKIALVAVGEGDGIQLADGIEGQVGAREAVNP